MEEKIAYEHMILLVDDEVSILKSMIRLLRRTTYTVVTAGSGKEALDFLAASDKSVSMIVSDQKMPGMTGAEFLEKSRAYVPDAIRFLLTGYSDMETLVDAINKGKVQRYISKPWDDNDLLLTIENGIKQYELVLENKRLMEITRKQNVQLLQVGRLLDSKVKQRTAELREKTQELEASLFNTIRSFSALMDTFYPEDSGHGRRVGAFAHEIAVKMGIEGEELRNIEMSALLHDIGKTGSSLNLSSPFQEYMTEIEKKKYVRHAEEGSLILRFIPQLDQIALYIRHHHENFDGTGFPEGLTGTAIPIGSRIIAVADAYDRIVAKKDRDENPFIGEYEKSPDRKKRISVPAEMSHNAAVYFIKKNTFAFFDPDVVKTFFEVLKTECFSYKKEKKITMDSLMPGMVLSKPLYTCNGRFLLPYSTVITSAVLSKLRSIHDSDPIQEPVYVAIY